MGTVIAGGHRLNAALTPPLRTGAPTVVFLHEGLGSLAQWRDFPARLRRATGCGTLVYDRWGYGASAARPGVWPASFMHDEAVESLPAVLTAAGLQDPPVLFGHSDGGSIALIFAARNPGAVRAVVTEAAHVMVEDVTIASIAAAAERFAQGGLRERLARHHGTNTDSLFAGWSGAWLSPDFRRWDLRPLLGGVGCPVLAIQGRDDEYGTGEQVAAIAAGCAGGADTLVIEACGHAPHAEQPRAVLAAVAAFLERAATSSAAPPSAQPL